VKELFFKIGLNDKIMMKVILKNLHIANKFLIANVSRDFHPNWMEEVLNYFREKYSNKIHFPYKMSYYNND
jgi:hypothetical protein